jgi:hypothetical protein
MRDPAAFESDEPRDTSPRARAVLLELYRNMSTGEKGRMVFEASERLLAAAAANERQLHPAADEREIFLRVAARHLSRDLMIRAYGWDPAAHP